MTLTDLLPSLRASLRPHLDPQVWPATARWAPGGDLVVGGVRLTTLAGTYGTPVHVLDEADVRARCAEYVAVFGAEAVAYSARAGLSVGAGRWIAEHNVGCYVASAQELKTALLAGFRPARILLGGSRKSVADREAEYACGAAVAYTDGDAGFALAAFASRMRAGVRLAAERYRIAAPALMVSPGRSVLARAGITVHRVTSVNMERVEGGRWWSSTVLSRTARRTRIAPAGTLRT